MSEPTITKPNEHGTGRPVITDEQYRIWLDDMRPFLRVGNTLWYAMEKCGLLQHKDSIYEKYRLNGWFSERIDALRQTIGELANSITFKLLENINVKIVEGAISLSKEDFAVLKLVVERHRSAQPFFANRTETAQVDENKIGKILDNLEMQSNYDKLGEDMKTIMEASRNKQKQPNT